MTRRHARLPGSEAADYTHRTRFVKPEDGLFREGGVERMTEHQWMALIGLLMVAVLVVPAALRRNRGRVLVNAALWLAAVVGLVWLYQTFGPF